MEKDSVFVGGDKRVTAETKAGDAGFFTDKFGNKIYVTSSAANQERLAALKPKRKRVAKKKEAGS